MSGSQELKCPKCGAKIFYTDAQCLSCGARLDQGRIVAEQPGQPPAPPVPTTDMPVTPPTPTPVTPAPVPGPATPPGGILSSAVLDPLGAAVNTSGEQGMVPPEVEQLGFNWGAFFLTWIWALAHQAWLGAALGFLLGFPVGSIILGITGNRWAWQNRHFASLEEFQAVQRAWAKWGLILFIIQIVLSIVVVVVVVALTVGGASWYADMLEQFENMGPPSPPPAPMP